MAALAFDRDGVRLISESASRVIKKVNNALSESLHNVRRSLKTVFMSCDCNFGKCLLLLVQRFHSFFPFVIINKTTAERLGAGMWFVLPRCL